jgi:maleylacetoacetate isomerase
MMPDESGQLRLYSYWRSSAAYRVRIALHLKGLEFTTVPVHLIRNGGEQHNETYRLLNPQGLVPVLAHNGHVLTQSLAICEYLDECFDQYPLLPLDSISRARVRSLTLYIACEVHPLNNLRVQKFLKGQCGDDIDTVEWMQHWMGEGFSAIEQQINDENIYKSVLRNDHPGLFECFLLPQVYNAERYGTDMSGFPAINKIVAHCRGLSAFIAAAPENQPDAEPL